VKSLAVTRNILRRIVNDRRTLVLIVFIPLFFVLLYGYSFSGKPRHMRILIVNQDNGLASVRTAEVGRITLDLRLAEEFIRYLDSEMFDIAIELDPDAARAQVGEGGVWAAVVFPQNFSHAVVNEALRSGGERSVSHEGRTVRLLPPESIEGPAATLTLDDSNPLVTSALLLGFKDALAHVLSGQQQAMVPEAVLKIDQVYDGEIRSLDYTAPGVIGFAMTLITIMLTSISIVRERTGGTLTRLLIAPVRAWQVTLGYTLAFAGIAMFQVGELFLVSALLFGVRIVGGVGWIALIVVLYAIGLQGIATLLSTLARNEFQAMQFILFLLVPSLMISGVFWPLEAMPPGIRPLSLLSPLTYANTSLRAVMLKGGGPSDIALELAFLAGFAALMLAFAVQSMRRQAHTA
jgi:ABC-2 type transport system permease protein